MVCLDNPDAEEHIYVHAGLLAQQSSWFAPRIKASPDGPITAQVSERLFDVFKVWLYTGRLVQPADAVPVGPPALVFETAAVGNAKWDDVDLANLYCFARKHHIRHLKNETITTFIATE